MKYLREYEILGKQLQVITKGSSTNHASMKDVQNLQIKESSLKCNCYRMQAKLTHTIRTM